MLAVQQDEAEDLQADFVDAFENGDVEGLSQPIERIDTHLNHIFLSGDRAYKFKRARKLPFVDFRSLDQRRHACESELALNRRLGSPFYLDVMGLVRRGGKLTLERTASALEWVVVMERFQSEDRFDLLAKGGWLTVETLEATAEMIAGTHAAARITRAIGHAADYRQIIQTLHRTEEEGAAQLGLSAGRADIYQQLDTELCRLDPLIEERRERGRVRRVHGDLHLHNLCMFHGRPTTFDALEFDERMATIDVLYDLSFLLMDLVSCGLQREANAVMNRYWDVSGECEGALDLLPFFMALRATVRMAVATERGDLVEADKYRKLASELLRPHPSVMMAIGGLSGTGKSAVAREVAPFLPGGAGARLIRSDVLRKRALGIGMTTPAGPSAYADERRAEVYRDMFAHAAAAAKSGASVVVDATFQTDDARQTLAAVLPSARLVWLTASLDERLRRIQLRANDASDADAAVATAQEDRGAPPGWLQVDASGPLASVITSLLRGAA